MKLRFIDAYGLWLKVHRLGTVSDLRLEAKDSILVTWVSISLAPIYILLQSFDQERSKFEEGTNDLILDIPITGKQIKDIDRLFTRHYLAPLGSLIPADMVDGLGSMVDGNSTINGSDTSNPGIPDIGVDSADYHQSINPTTNTATGINTQENLYEDQKEDGFELSNGFGPEHR